MSQASGQNRDRAQASSYPALTGIRFIAAFWVVLFHAAQQIPDNIMGLPMPTRLISRGDQAVPLFFILSGFVLGLNYLHTFRPRDYLWFGGLRFARIWPAHVATIVVLIIYQLIIEVGGGGAFIGPYKISALPFELLMVRCWWSKDMIWNFPSWSVHSEWFAYLGVFPLVVVIAKGLNRSWAALFGAVACIGVHCLLPLEALPGYIGNIAFLFGAGVLLYRYKELNGHAEPRGIGLGSLLLIAAGVWLDGSLMVSRILLYSGFALLIVALTATGSILVSSLSARGLVYGGTVSYSLYLAHAPAFKISMAAKRAVGRKFALAVQVPDWFVMIPSAIIGALLLYHFVEAPCHKRLRIYFQNWRPAAKG